MMKQFKAKYSLLLVLLLLGGCSDTTAPDSSDVSDTPVEPAEGVTVGVEYATDAVLNQYNSYIDETEAGEYAVDIIFTTNVPLQDFQYIEVDYLSEDDEITYFYFSGEPVYTLEEFSPDEPLVVSIYFPGVLPTKGIAFTDENGAQRYYYVLQSGDDGSLSLVEFSG